jgi:hypothetical protein
MSVRSARPVAVAAGVALLVVVVALASRPAAGTTAPVVGAALTRTVLDLAFYLLVALSLVDVLILVWLLWPHEDLGPSPRLARRRHSLFAAVLLAVTLVLVAWSRGGVLGRLPLFGPGPSSVAGRSGVSRLGTGAGAAAQGVDWAAVTITALVLAVIATLGWRALRTRGPILRVVRSPLAELREALEDALVDAAEERDPRQAVIAVWSRVERLLADHDASRRPSEAPFEYAARAAAAAGLDAGALERLAGLYEWARFSVHEVTSAMRREAIDGLAQVRERLRLAT